MTEDDVAKEIVCGNNVQQHKRQIEKYIEAGFEHIYIHQVGPDQEAFFRFYERGILPAYSQ